MGLLGLEANITFINTRKYFDFYEGPLLEKHLNDDIIIMHKLGPEDVYTTWRMSNNRKLTKPLELQN